MRTPHPNARALRKDMPAAERKLWSRLRMKRIDGLRFRRQHTIGPYIADFACLEAMLVIELDGAQHADGEARAYDARRDEFMEKEGWLVVRYWNEDVYGRIEDLVNDIHRAAFERRQARNFGLS
jgi:primosomal protein N' (replication factor Y)